MKLKYTILTVLLAFLTAIPIIQAAKATQNKDLVVLNKNNAVSVNDEVSPESVASWTQKVRALDNKTNNPIYLVMNTPGGSIQAGIDFIEAMKGIHRPVNTVTIFSASMGFQIVQNLGERLVLKNGILMSHRAAGGVEGSFGGPEPSQLTSRYNFYLQELKSLDEQTVSRTNGKQTLESYQKSYANEMWRAGTSSVTEGYADRVVSLSCDSTLNGTTHHTLQVMVFTVDYDLSDCPMITAPLNVTINILTNKGIVSEKEFLQKGGRFDAYCMQDSNKDKLCSLDTSLNVQKINEIKQQFQSNYATKQNKALDYTF